jgi:hypothetical protein
MSVVPAAWGERLVSAWRRKHRRDLSTPPQSLTLLRSAVEMTSAMDARSILMPIADLLLAVLDTAQGFMEAAECCMLLLERIPAAAAEAPSGESAAT